MSELYRKYKDRDIVILVPLVLLATAKIVAHFLWLLRSGRGLPKCADSTWYLNYAGSLLANLRDGLDINDTLYFGYNILLALLLAIFRDPVVIIFIQCLVVAFSVILVYKIARLLFNKATAVIASVFYIGAWDITMWAMYLLTDSFFVSLLLLSVYCLLMAMETGDRKYRLLFHATALYLVIFRPTGILVVAVLLAYTIYRLPRPAVVSFLKKHRLALGLLPVILAAGGAWLYAAGSLDPFIASFQLNAKKVLYNIYANGWIYDKATPHDHYFRPDYKIDIGDSLVLSFIVNNWDHVAVIYAKRAVAFLGHWVWKTDLGTLAGLGSFAANIWPAALFAAGTYAAVTERRFGKASVLWLIILAVFAFCLLLFIDWMYRYRLPAIPFIAIVAAFGAERIACLALVAAKKLTGLLQYEKRQNTDCHPGL